jgi:hypothetical protein
MPAYRAYIEGSDEDVLLQLQYAARRGFEELPFFRSSGVTH